MQKSHSQQSWVRSQHPPAQWNLGAADEAVLNIVHRKKSKKCPCLVCPMLTERFVFQTISKNHFFVEENGDSFLT
jgi:hypothetical protein